MSSRILYYENIVKGEFIAKTNKRMFVWIGYVEPHPILWKYSERRAHRQVKETFVYLNWLCRAEHIPYKYNRSLAKLLMTHRSSTHTRHIRLCQPWQHKYTVSGKYLYPHIRLPSAYRKKWNDTNQINHKCKHDTYFPSRPYRLSTAFLTKTRLMNLQFFLTLFWQNIFAKEM